MFVRAVQIERANPQLSINGLFPLRAEILWRHFIHSKCVSISFHWSLSEKATSANVIDILSHMFTIQRLPTRSKTFFAVKHAHVLLTGVLWCFVGRGPVLF